MSQWRQKDSEATKREIGEGLMEPLAFHPDGRFLLMAGRLFKGKWSAALFDHEQNVGFRISASAFTPDGKPLYLADGANQGNPKDEKKWGRIVIYEVK